jgi:CHAT domain-containing protein
VEKVEALREAQLDLLLGRVKPKSDTTARGVGLDAGYPPASFAHPYYWAPFVLMGNWK